MRAMVLERQGEPLQHAIAYLLYGEGAERGLRRGFPDGGIAGDGGQASVPRPHRNRKIKCRNNSYRPDRVILFIHAVQRPFRLHSEAV